MPYTCWAVLQWLRCSGTGSGLAVVQLRSEWRPCDHGRLSSWRIPAWVTMIGLFIRYVPSWVPFLTSLLKKMCIFVWFGVENPLQIWRECSWTPCSAAWIKRWELEKYWNVKPSQASELDSVFEYIYIYYCIYIHVYICIYICT